mmetsp:Transcript_1790/g.2535  ORF Transcript_1790/g.2535 Transcript_1790/m.2535 type:complete len:254 (+) Transcript_1790:902-1663(+)
MLKRFPSMDAKPPTPKRRQSPSYCSSNHKQPFSRSTSSYHKQPFFQSTSSKQPISRTRSSKQPISQSIPSNHSRSRSSSLHRHQSTSCLVHHHQSLQKIEALFHRGPQVLPFRLIDNPTRRFITFERRLLVTVHSVHPLLCDVVVQSPFCALLFSDILIFARVVRRRRRISLLFHQTLVLSTCHFVTHNEANTFTIRCDTNQLTFDCRPQPSSVHASFRAAFPHTKQTQNIATLVKLYITVAKARECTTNAKH